MIDNSLNKNSKILYISDVPVEATTGGEMLMYKLFKDHPPDKLLIIQTRNDKEIYDISKNSELLNVKYINFKYLSLPGSSIKFIYHINHWINYLYSLCWYRKVKKLATNFDCDVIVTVGHHFFWTTAFRISKKLNKPLRVIVHDHWDVTVSGLLIKKYLGVKFGIMFREANRRFVVSPFMAEVYAKRYGFKSQILYPIAQNITGSFENSLKQRKPSELALTIGYAGSLWNGYPNNIISLSHALSFINCNVMAFTNKDIHFLRKNGLKTNNIKLFPFLSVERLLRKLREECDILYLPMDFDPVYEMNMRLAFPSKIAEYTLLKLPILIHAPKYSSIVKWAIEHEDLKFSEIVTSLDGDEIILQVKKLFDYNHRFQLGQNAYRIGQTYFDHSIVKKVFYN